MVIQYHMQMSWECLPSEGGVLRAWRPAKRLYNEDAKAEGTALSRLRGKPLQTRSNVGLRHVGL